MSSAFKLFFHGMLARGINLAPVSLRSGLRQHAMHGAAEIEQTIEAAAQLSRPSLNC